MVELGWQASGIFRLVIYLPPFEPDGFEDPCTSFLCAGPCATSRGGFCFQHAHIPVFSNARLSVTKSRTTKVQPRTARIINCPLLPFMTDSIANPENWPVVGDSHPSFTNGITIGNVHQSLAASTEPLTISRLAVCNHVYSKGGPPEDEPVL